MIAAIFDRRDVPKVPVPKDEYFENIIEQIEEKLAEFGIEGKNCQCSQGACG